ncbi:hypothetical protein BDR07DRAFT_1458615 [Suillus spraguei]|nr:hypothetical protein BDR07DRAFT_1458615 [Suillus spraguei]
MRPTAARLDGMPGPKTFNPWWGDTSMQKQRGVVVYISNFNLCFQFVASILVAFLPYCAFLILALAAVSPFRQRGSKALISGWLFNGYRRLAAQVPYWIVPFAIGYGTYTWAKSRYAWQNSKAGHIALGGHH